MMKIDTQLQYYIKEGVKPMLRWYKNTVVVVNQNDYDGLFYASDIEQLDSLVCIAEDKELKVIVWAS